MSRETIEDVEAELMAGAQVVSLSLEFALAAARSRWPGISAAPETASAVVVDDDAEAASAVASGAPALKLKLDAADDLARVRVISAAAPGVLLRVDANRIWPAAEIVERIFCPRRDRGADRLGRGTLPRHDCPAGSATCAADRAWTSRSST